MARGWSGRLGPAWWVVIAGTVVFAVVHGVLVLRHHAAFGTQAFDFGIFDQGLWLLSRFEAPFVTVRGLHLFGDHSSYAMVPLTPLYWVWPDPRALLLLTVVVLALAGPLLFALGRAVALPPVLAAGVALGFLLHPSLSWQAWWNFHPELLAVSLVPLGFLLLVRERTWWGVGVLVLVLLVKEDAPLVIAPAGLYVAWRWRAWRAGLTLTGAAVVAFVLHFWVLLPHFSPTGELLYTGRYGHYGEGLRGALAGMLADPVRVGSDLVAGQRPAYLALMLLPLPLCLAAPRLLLLAAPITIANLLSLHGYQHEIRWHYAAYLLAVAGVAGVAGAKALVDALGRHTALPLAGAVLAAALAAHAGAGPSPIGRHHDHWSRPRADDHLVREALDRIPDDAAVAADPFLVPQLAHRRSVFMFPNPFLEDNWGAPGEPWTPRPELVDWVLTWVPPRPGDQERALADLERSGAFEVVVDNARVRLHRRVPG